MSHSSKRFATEIIGEIKEDIFPSLRVSETSHSDVEPHAPKVSLSAAGPALIESASTRNADFKD